MEQNWERFSDSKIMSNSPKSIRPVERPSSVSPRVFPPVNLPERYGSDPVASETHQTNRNSYMTHKQNKHTQNTAHEINRERHLRQSQCRIIPWTGGRSGKVQGANASFGDHARIVSDSHSEKVTQTCNNVGNMGQSGKMVQ